jgi:hypothetical protein
MTGRIISRRTGNLIRSRTRRSGRAAPNNRTCRGSAKTQRCTFGAAGRKIESKRAGLPIVAVDHYQGLTTLGTSATCNFSMRGDTEPHVFSG